MKRAHNNFVKNSPYLIYFFCTQCVIINKFRTENYMAPFLIKKYCRQKKRNNLKSEIVLHHFKYFTCRQWNKEKDLSKIFTAFQTKN